MVPPASTFHCRTGSPGWLNFGVVRGLTGSSEHWILKWIISPVLQTLIRGGVLINCLGRFHPAEGERASGRRNPYGVRCTPCIGRDAAEPARGEPPQRSRVAASEGLANSHRGDTDGDLPLKR